MKKSFHIGKIVNTHGVKGEVKVYPYTDDVNKFVDFDHLYVEDQKIQIETVRIHKNMALVKFKGYDNMDLVLPLMNKNVFIDRDLVDDGGDGHYIVDLIGCEIFDESGIMIGVLVDVLQNTSQDLYQIRRSDNGEDFYLPVVDEFVKNIDLNTRRIIVRLIEGLME
ncbi:MAG: 16S rRNA processing protein RimM [Clostridia bacterium]|nr:16S rRNA processing protein RimM [Clostridia bacterium]